MREVLPTFRLPDFLVLNSHKCGNGLIAGRKKFAGNWTKCHPGLVTSLDRFWKLGLHTSLAAWASPVVSRKAGNRQSLPVASSVCAFFLDPCAR